jgi:hypothetical protein
MTTVLSRGRPLPGFPDFWVVVFGNGDWLVSGHGYGALFAATDTSIAKLIKLRRFLRVVRSLAGA